ncbi:Swarming motility protein YbiA [compost metagenome]
MATVTTDKFVLFWKSDSIYSNWYNFNSRFVWRFRRFENSEAALMYAKADFFKDEHICASVMVDQDPYSVKKLGRLVKPYDDKAWSLARYDLMVDILKAKFEQNPTMARKLLATGDRILVEASPSDKIWGIGLAPDDPNAQIPARWLGQNLLGKALMEVREYLRNLPMAA